MCQNFLISSMFTSDNQCPKYLNFSLHTYINVQKKKAKLSSFVQFEKEMASYRALLLNKAQLPMF